MNQIEMAVHQTAHEAQGGLIGMARDIGIGEQVLRNKVNPYQDTHKLGLYEAIAMMRRDGDLRILSAIAAEFGRTLNEPVARSPRTLVLEMLAADAEHGDVTRRVSDALADGRITAAEASAIRKEIGEAHVELDLLEQAIIKEARN